MLATTSRLLVAVMLAAGSMILVAAPASAREVIKARSGNSWTGNIVAQVGEKVIWTNPTFQNHNVKSYNQGKKWRLRRTLLQISNGNQVTRKFRKRGKYFFRCTLHSTPNGNGGFNGMIGIVRVRS
jgi:plastocyanin